MGAHDQDAFWDSLAGRHDGTVSRVRRHATSRPSGASGWRRVTRRASAPPSPMPEPVIGHNERGRPAGRTRLRRPRNEAPTPGGTRPNGLESADVQPTPSGPLFVHASRHDPGRPRSMDVRPPRRAVFCPRLATRRRRPRSMDVRPLHQAVFRPRLPARSRPAAKLGRPRATGSGRFSSTPRRTTSCPSRTGTPGRPVRPVFVHAWRHDPRPPRSMDASGVGPGEPARPAVLRPPLAARPPPAAKLGRPAASPGRPSSPPPGPIPAGRQAGTSPSYRIGPVFVHASRHHLPPTAKPGRPAAPSGRFSSTPGATIPVRREAWTPPASGPANRPARPSFVPASPHDPRRPPSWDVRPPHRAVLRPRLPARSRPAAKLGRPRATGSGRFSSTPRGTTSRPPRSRDARPPRQAGFRPRLAPRSPSAAKRGRLRRRARRTGPASRHPGRPARGTPPAPPRQPSPAPNPRRLCWMHSGLTRREGPDGPGLAGTV